MLVNRQNLPAHLPWMLIAAVTTILATVWYAIHAQASPQWPGGSSVPGFIFGLVAGAIIVFEFLLWPRKWRWVRAWRIGRTQVWMRAHIWLGLLCTPLVVLHHGLSFQWGGTLTVVLMVLFWIVIASGIFGLALQQILPRYMLNSLPAESIASQIPHLSQQMIVDAERMISNACGPGIEPLGVETAAAEEIESDGYVVVGAVRAVGNVKGKVLETEVPVIPIADRRSEETIRRAFRETIRPYLQDGNKTGSILSKPIQADAFFATLKTNLVETAHPLAENLQRWCETRRQFDTQTRVHGWLHGWMCVHLPLSLALVVLLALHAFGAIRYSGVWPL